MHHSRCFSTLAPRNSPTPPGSLAPSPPPPPQPVPSLPPRPPPAPLVQAEARRLRGLADQRQQRDGQASHVSVMFLAQAGLRLLTMAAVMEAAGREAYKPAE